MASLPQFIDICWVAIYHCTEWLNTLISVLWPNLARFIIIPKMVSPVLCSFLAERSGFFDTIWADILQHDHITTYDPSSTFNDDWHNSFLATLLTKFYEKKHRWWKTTLNSRLKMNKQQASRLKSTRKGHKDFTDSQDR